MIFAGIFMHISSSQDIVLHMVNGESYGNLLMQVIQYCVTSNNHRIKKLLQLYWEIVDKYKENGEWKEEMILGRQFWTMS